MNREEAIKRIEKMVEDDDELGCLFIRKDIEALKVAISALSAEGEYIKKEDALAELNKWDWQELYLPIHFKQILDDVSSAENKGERR